MRTRWVPVRRGRGGGRFGALVLGLALLAFGRCGGGTDGGGGAAGEDVAATADAGGGDTSPGDGSAGPDGAERPDTGAADTGAADAGAPDDAAAPADGATAAGDARDGGLVPPSDSGAGTDTPVGPPDVAGPPDVTGPPDVAGPPDVTGPPDAAGPPDTPIGTDSGLATCEPARGPDRSITLTADSAIYLDDPRAFAAGETLFGLSLLYRVSADSIAAANEFDLNAPIQSGQSLVIPWPTATPPLESVLLEINGEPVMADATNCEIITIQDGDSAYALSAIRGVPIEVIIAVNRQTMESIALLQPGDTLCIPRILYGDTIPPTAGPSPTPSLTPPPSGPALLYPADGTTFTADAGPIVVQWAAVKDLGEDEWYMVEVRDMDDRDSLPHRGFTRDQSLRLPDEWRPSDAGQRQMQWQVSIVAVTGRRSDGGFIYTFRGTAGAPSTFFWEAGE